MPPKLPGKHQPIRPVAQLEIQDRGSRPVAFRQFERVCRRRCCKGLMPLCGQRGDDCIPHDRIIIDTKDGEPPRLGAGRRGRRLPGRRAIRRQGDIHREQRTPARPGAQRDGDVQQARRPLHDGKAKADTGGVAVEPFELPEDARLRVRRDSGAAVGHGEADPPLPSPCREGDAAMRRVADRVGQEVEQDGPQQIPIRLHAGIDSDRPQPKPLFGRQRFELAAQFRHQIPCGEAGGTGLDAACIQLGDIQQRPQQGIGRADRLRGRIEQRAGRIRRLPLERGQEQPRGMQRLQQIMAGGGEEAGLFPRGGFGGRLRFGQRGVRSGEVGGSFGHPRFQFHLLRLFGGDVGEAHHIAAPRHRGAHRLDPAARGAKPLEAVRQPARQMVQAALHMRFHLAGAAITPFRIVADEIGNRPPHFHQPRRIVEQIEIALVPGHQPQAPVDHGDARIDRLQCCFQQLPGKLQRLARTIEQLHHLAHTKAGARHRGGDDQPGRWRANDIRDHLFRAAGRRAADRAVRPAEGGQCDLCFAVAREAAGKPRQFAQRGDMAEAGIAIAMVAAGAPEARGHQQGEDIGAQAPQRSVHERGTEVDPQQPLRMQEPPGGGIEGCHQIVSGEGGKEQRVGPQRDPGHQPGAGGALVFEPEGNGADQRGGELRHAGKGDQADRGQRGAVVDRFGIAPGRRDDQHDDHPPRHQHQPPQIRAFAQPGADQQWRQQIVRRHGGQRQGFRDDHACRSRKAAEEGQKNQTVRAFRQRQRQHEQVWQGGGGQQGQAGGRQRQDHQRDQRQIGDERPAGPAKRGRVGGLHEAEIELPGKTQDRQRGQQGGDEEIGAEAAAHPGRQRFDPDRRGGFPPQEPGGEQAEREEGHELHKAFRGERGDDAGVAARHFDPARAEADGEGGE